MPNGTGYISDLGMTGIMDSILGTKKEIIIDFYYNAGKRQRFEKAEDGEVWFNGCIFEIDNKTKKASLLKDCGSAKFEVEYERELY